MWSCANAERLMIDREFLFTKPLLEGAFNKDSLFGDSEPPSPSSIREPDLSPQLFNIAPFSNPKISSSLRSLSENCFVESPDYP